MLEMLDAIQANEIPEPARQEMHGFYDRYQPWRNHFLHHFAPFVCEADRVFAVRSQRPKLLDLGCGVATQAHLLAMRGATITGLDNSVPRVEAGRAMTDWFTARAPQAPLELSLATGDAFAWLERQPPGGFDGCYTQFALAYMQPHSRILHLIDRVVRPGGRILFREFNAGSLYNRMVSRVDWLSARDYQRVGQQLGWTCRARQFCWLFPRQIMGWNGARQGLRSLEDGLTRLPAVGPALAAAMTLEFEKPT